MSALTVSPPRNALPSQAPTSTVTGERRSTTDTPAESYPPTSSLMEATARGNAAGQCRLAAFCHCHMRLPSPECWLEAVQAKRMAQPPVLLHVLIFAPRVSGCMCPPWVVPGTLWF